MPRQREALKELRRAELLKPGDVICVPAGMAVIKNVYETDSGIRIIYVNKRGGGRRDVPRDKLGTVYSRHFFQVRRFFEEVWRSRSE